jgi:PIN domain nuclease of toxin-antitoxin system
MRLLLDTHIFIWWAIQRGKLSATALTVCEDFSNELYLSLASLWEMQIKLQTGKLSFQRPLAQLVAEQQQLNGL